MYILLSTQSMYVLAATNRISYMEICLVLLMLHITECRTHVSLKSFVKPLSWWARFVLLEFRWHFCDYGMKNICIHITKKIIYLCWIVDTCTSWLLRKSTNYIFCDSILGIWSSSGGMIFLALFSTHKRCNQDAWINLQQSSKRRDVRWRLKFMTE